MASSAEEIRQHLRGYLSSKSSLDDFEDWFLAHNWNAHLDSAEHASELVNHVEGLLIAFSADAISAREFHKELTKIANPFVIVKVNPGIASRQKEMFVCYTKDAEPRMMPPVSAGSSPSSDLAGLLQRVA